jgi:RES domain-containing protein
LAALEYLGTLVDIDDAPADLVVVGAQFDDSVVEAVNAAALPGWDAIPPNASIRFGTRWTREKRSVVLQVPSVMIPSESNFILNPEHPDFARAVHVGVAQPFAFDRRLLRRR